MHRLFQRISWLHGGYLATAFDIFCSISAHARRVALALVRTTVGLVDCMRLLGSRGSVGFGDDAWLRWPALFGDVDRSCLFARDASVRATISRR